jgi:dTDP-4-dehydrorhamnose reductase
MSGRLLVIGCNGQLGRAVVKEWKTNHGWLGRTPGQVIGVDRLSVDIRFRDEVRGALRRFPSPDVVVNCAAMTDVDGCEKNPPCAYEINYIGAQHVAAACEAQGAFLVHISTDYVFGGNYQGRPYQEWDEPSPINVYGRSKLLGERAVQTHCPQHAIVRTAWLYSKEGMEGGRPTFVNKIADAVMDSKAEPLRVVNDQYGDPTDTQMLAKVVCHLAAERMEGLYHATANDGPVSRYEEAAAIREIVGGEREILPVPTEHYPAPAKRPVNTSLDNWVLRQKGLFDEWHWQAELERVLKSDR